jgi:hypothetical protein
MPAYAIMNSKESKQKDSGIQLPINNSIRLSKIIAALDRHLGMTGFAFPVADTRDGIEYEFDLHHMESKNPVKVFYNATLFEIFEYHPLHKDEDIIFIVDASEEQTDAPDDEWPNANDLSDEVLALAFRFNALIYFNDKIWAWKESESENDGCGYEPVFPWYQTYLLKTAV